MPRGIEISDHMRSLTPLQKGEPAPVWKYPELNTGNLLSLDSLKGKVVVLDFTSTWCIHCVEGSIHLMEVRSKYKDHDVIFITVFSSILDTREKVMSYVRRRNIEGITVYNAAGSDKAYRINGYPGFFVIDRQGRIAEIHPGYSKELKDRISQAIEACL